jgi:hypothetical protein
MTIKWNAMCDSGLDPFAIKDVTGTMSRMWIGSEDDMV